MSINWNKRFGNCNTNIFVYHFIVHGNLPLNLQPMCACDDSSLSLAVIYVQPTVCPIIPRADLHIVRVWLTLNKPIMSFDPHTWYCLCRAARPSHNIPFLFILKLHIYTEKYIRHEVYGLINFHITNTPMHLAPWSRSRAWQASSKPLRTPSSHCSPHEWLLSWFLTSP